MRFRIPRCLTRSKRVSCMKPSKKTGNRKMEVFRKELLVGGSRAALVAAASFFATPVLAQPAAPAPVEEVTVTGTSIRGAAPVGSNVITGDQEAIRTSGAKNMEELLNTIPALSTANAPPQGVNNNSFFAPQI